MADQGLPARTMHCTNMIEATLRFGQWMATRATPATCRDVMDAFPVSRPTAYRWINAWRAANGLQPLGFESPSHRNRMRKRA